jgi:TrmH family RNA methyltransferase
MSDITSVHNPRIKAAMKLRDRRDRASTGHFLIDGRREIERALVGKIEIEEAFVKEGADEALATLVEKLRGTQTKILVTAPAPFERLAFGERDEGVVVVAKTPRCDLASLALPENPLIAVLEGVEKPGNVGAVLRTADAAGISAVIIADGGTDLFNPNAIRASLGAIFTVPICAASSPEVLAWLQQRGIAIFAARVDGAVDYASVSYCGPSAIALGSEAHGLTPVWQPPEVTAISLPMLGVVDSLNVSATAAALFYEANRQRRIAVGQASSPANE